MPKAIAPPVAATRVSMPLQASIEARREAARLDQQGREHAEKQDFKEALVVMNRAIEINPRYARAFNARGYVQLRLANYPQAIADFTEAIRLDPTYANAYHNRAVTRKLVGEVEGAKADEVNAKKYSAATVSLTASR